MQSAPKTENSKPNIFEYHDYREFLRDHFDFHSDHTKGFSLRSLSRQADISSGYLSLFLKESIPLSDKVLRKILPHIFLLNHEKSYLVCLHQLAESRQSSLRKDALKRLQRFRNYQSAHPKELETFKYLSSWLNVAVRELAALPEFQNDPKWIQSKLRFKASLKEIRDSIAFLNEHGLLTNESQSGTLKCDSGVYQLSLAEYHTEMLELAKKSIHDATPDERDIQSYTLGIPKNKVTRVRELFDELMQELEQVEKTNKDKSDSVYHVSLAAFPLASKSKKDGA